ncbi:MAG: primosomal replication protein N [Candidimonas sp.]|nr:MAG: primosomal replication protein N [Candidimonas sp.]TAM25407.1 MAG: primosomal replication protein N [Candidimonas sp.]
MNQITMTATALEVKPLRYTPAGLPAIEMILNHDSEVLEAGHMRRVELVLPAVALGDIALLLADTPLGAALSVEGFLAPTRKGSTKMVLHIQQADRVFANNATALV